MSRRPSRRTLLAVLLGLLVAGGVGVHSLRQRAAARDAFPQADGRIEVAGLSGPVEILRDERGVPHIFAASDTDALYGLGFAHAQDRLAQMLWLVRCARGRTAEVAGADGLAADRLARTLDLAGLAAAELEAIDAETRLLLDAYAAGVNARIARIRAGRAAPPLALAERGMPLEDWQAQDSLAVLKLYAWNLSGSLDASLVLSDLIEHLGGFAARRFFPEGDSGDPFPAPAPLPTTARLRKVGASAEAALRRAAGMSGRSIGSTAWVVGGAHTRSGRPILVADAHLEPTAPALLHVAHVRGEALEVTGATVPGVPIFWSGHNGRVAWASTHARAATTDLFVETLRARDGTSYHDGKRWLPVDERVETIRVKGGADVVLGVRSTRHGPLVNELFEETREPLALQWAGARSGGATLRSLLDVARARDAGALVQALAPHGDPPLAVVYADARGAAGLQVAGWIPRRSMPTSLVPVPGRARFYDWRDRIPFEALPRVKLEDGRGWAIAADNPLASRDESARIEWLWRTGERAGRVEQLLRAAERRGPLDLRRTAALQRDQRMRRAREIVADALALVGDPEALPPEAREVVRLLEDWEGDARPDSQAAAAYHVLLESLTSQLLGRHLEESLLRRYLALPQVDPAALVTALLRDAARGGEPGGWSDPEVAREAAARSLRETWLRLSFLMGPNRAKWSWGRLHRLRFRSFGPDGASTLAGLGPFPYGGGATTVNVAEYDPAMPFDVRVAATYRFGVDARELGEAFFALAPGPSEHAGHPHFQSGLDDWLRGRPAVLVSSRLLVESTAVSRLELVPRP